MGAVPVRSFLSPTWGTASIRTHAVAPFPHRRELASVRLPSQTLFETADEPRQAMSSHLRDSSEAWTQSISSSDLYHHEQYRYHHHNTTTRAESSSQPGWPSNRNEVKAEAPRRSPPTPLKLPQSAEPADEANLSRQLDEVVDLLSQQPRSDGGPRRPMNAFLIFARWRRMQLAQIESVHEETIWTNEGRKRRKSGTPDLGLKPSDVSTALGVEWRGLTPQQQAPFLRKAGELRNDFDRRHPDYKFRRGPKGAAKMRRQERRERATEARRRLQQRKASIEHARTHFEEASEPGYARRLTERDPSDAQRAGQASLPDTSTRHHLSVHHHGLLDHRRRSFSLSDDPPETPIIDSSGLTPYAGSLNTLPYHSSSTARDHPFVSERRSDGTRAGSSSVAETNVVGGPFWLVGSRTDLPPLHQSMELLAPTLHNGRPRSINYSNSLAASSDDVAPLRRPDFRLIATDKGPKNAEGRDRPDLPSGAHSQSNRAQVGCEPSSSSSQFAWAPASAPAESHPRPIGRKYLEDSEGATTVLPVGRQQVASCSSFRFPAIVDPSKKYQAGQFHHHRHHYQRQLDYLNGGYYQPLVSGVTGSNDNDNVNSYEIGHGRSASHLFGQSTYWTPAREQGSPKLAARTPQDSTPAAASAAASVLNSSETPPQPPLQEVQRLSRSSSTLEAALQFPNTKCDAKPRVESQLQCSSRLPQSDVEQGRQYNLADPLAGTAVEIASSTDSETEPSTSAETTTAAARGHSSAFSRLLEAKFGQNSG